MLKARIITSSPERAGEVVHSLEDSGYEVELVHPDNLINSYCDLEINLDEQEGPAATEAPLEQFYQPEQVDTGQVIEEREFLLAPLWRSAKGWFDERRLRRAPAAPNVVEQPAAVPELTGEPNGPSMNEPQGPGWAQRASEYWNTIGERLNQRITQWQRERWAEQETRRQTRAAREAEARLVEERARLATARLEEERTRLEASRAAEQARLASLLATSHIPAEAVQTLPQRVEIGRRLAEARGRVFTGADRVSAKLSTWRHKLASKSGLRGREYAYRQALPIAAGVVLAFILGLWAANTGAEERPSAPFRRTDTSVRLPAVPAATASTPSMQGLSEFEPQQRPVAAQLGPMEQAWDEEEVYGDEVVVRHYPRRTRTTKTAAPAPKQEASIKRYSDVVVDDER